jgi:hypothetical protein
MWADVHERGTGGVSTALPPSAPPGGRLDLLLAAVSLVAVALPFLAVRFPPVADLPQQAVQIRLFLEALSDPASPYAIHPLDPNRLSYLVLGAAWALVGPEHAGRLAMVAIGCLWVVAAHLVARRRGRPAEAAVLASLLFFNHATYWGFYSFACGLPAFVVFLHVADRQPDRLRWRDRLALFAGLLVLFLVHALWFAAGVAWLAASSVLFRGIRASLSRGLTVLPLVAWAYAWQATLAGTQLDAPPVWRDVWQRTGSEWLVDAALGGLAGEVERWVVAALVAWLVAGLLARAASPEARWDRALAAAAVLCFLAALALPDKTHNTIRFAQRWMPIAFFLAVLAVPAALRRRGIAAALACGLALAFSARTAVGWRAFERVELSGLEQSLAALPERPRVLGLDLVKRSDVVRGRPFLQTFAYAQLLRGGSLAFSFVVFPSSLVGLRVWRPEPWTRNLVWNAEWVRPEDATHFDFVLVNGRDDAAHEAIARRLRLGAITREGRWRLYRAPPPSRAPEVASPPDATAKVQKKRSARRSAHAPPRS